jgi:orotidine-5'-phosphate decarboxylase
MGMGTFAELLRGAWSRSDSLVCVGLDPEPAQFPAAFAHRPDAIFEFCRAVVDATADIVCAFKPQIAHFAAHRAEPALERLVAHIHTAHPGIPVILDAKRGDIDSTASRYAAEAFDRYGADAVTVNPYLGRDAVQPFLDRADKGVFLLCRTSNPGARDLQDLVVKGGESDGRRLYEHVARMVAREWNANGNCALVVGATYARELGEVRALAAGIPLLVPGIGTQGGDVAGSVRHGCTSDGTGLILSSSRAILYASQENDFADAARAATMALRSEVNAYRG